MTIDTLRRGDLLICPLPNGGTGVVEFWGHQAGSRLAGFGDVCWAVGDDCQIPVILGETRTAFIDSIVGKTFDTIGDIANAVVLHDPLFFDRAASAALAREQ